MTAITPGRAVAPGTVLIASRLADRVIALVFAATVMLFLIGLAAL